MYVYFLKSENSAILSGFSLFIAVLNNDGMYWEGLKQAKC